MSNDRNDPGLILLAGPALTMLREDCAPKFATLLGNPRIPSAHLARLIDWSERLQGEDPSRAFDPEHLPDLLRALNIALLSSYGFAAVPPGPGANLPPERVDLEVSDLGGARLIDRARTSAMIIIAALHGERGVAIAQASQAELHRLMDGISAAVARTR